MSTPHTVPLVVERLYALVDAHARGLEDPDDPDSVIRVDLGDPGPFDEPAAIGIALATAPVEPVETRQTVQSLRTETLDFDVVCVALAWSGDDDGMQWMYRAYELVDLVRDVVDDKANRHLGLDRRVESAAIDRDAFGWVRDGNRLMAQVEFTVRVRAYRPRAQR